MRFWEGRSDVEVIWLISGVVLPTLFLMASFMTLRAMVKNGIRRRQLLRAGVVIGMMEDEQRKRRRRRIRLPGAPRFRMPDLTRIAAMFRRDGGRRVNLGGDRRAALRMMESMEAARVASAADVLAEAMASTPGVAEGMAMAGSPVAVDHVSAGSSVTLDRVSAAESPVDDDPVAPPEAGVAMARVDRTAVPQRGPSGETVPDGGSNADTTEVEDDAEADQKWKERMKDFDGRAPSDAAARVVNRGAAKEGGLAARVTARQKKQRKRIGRGKGLV